MLNLHFWCESEKAAFYFKQAIEMPTRKDAKVKRKSATFDVQGRL
jgi:hypothetical protein